MAHIFYTQRRINSVVGVAIYAARASAQGHSTIEYGHKGTMQTFHLKQGGYCARFVRQVYETACGFEPHSWSYAAADARGITAKLAADGHEVTDGSLLPGDIIGIHKRSGEFGHIAIYVGRIDGQDMIAENTSSRFRGKPRRAGTKLTRYEDIAHRVTGVYRLLDLAAKPKSKLEGLYVNGKRVGEMRNVEGTAYAPVRALAEALGARVDWQPGRVDVTAGGEQ